MSASKIWSWVNDNLNTDPAILRLKFHGKQIGDFDAETLIRQVECRQKFGKKLAATLASNPYFFFPTTLAGEQSTSDALAQWHASLIPEGSSLIDLTAGLGIDAIYCSKRCKSVTAIEQNPIVAEALAINAPEINVVQGDCRNFIRDYHGHRFDVAFIDPARRNAGGGRVYDIRECQPDVTEMLPEVERIAGRLIIKLSPMLDIRAVMGVIPGISEIIALGIPTECKELVLDLRFDHTPGSPIIKAVTLGVPPFAFTTEECAAAQPRFDNPQAGMWIYEPFPCIMKTGGFSLLCERYGVSAIAPNTHVFISKEAVAAFPGNAREIIEVIPFNSKYIKRLASKYPRIDVAVRNFPLSADALARKLKVKQGSEFRLLGVTSATGNPLMIIAR